MPTSAEPTTRAQQTSYVIRKACMKLLSIVEITSPTTGDYTPGGIMQS